VRLDHLLSREIIVECFAIRQYPRSISISFCGYLVVRARKKALILYIDNCIGRKETK
jgi:hypothetical protein